MIFESYLATLAHPTKRTLRAFRWQFFNGSHDEDYPTLGAHSASLFNNTDDLVTLGTREEHDRLTTLVQDHLAWIFHVRSLISPLFSSLKFILLTTALVNRPNFSTAKYYVRLIATSLVSLPS
jgi:hypothetical protein